MTGTIRWSLALAAATAATVPLRAQGAPPVIAVLPFENTGSYGQDKESFEALEIGLPADSGVDAGRASRCAGRGSTRECARRSQQQKLGATRRIDAASATAVAKAVGRAVRHHRQLRRFLRQVSHHAAGGGRGDRADPEGRLQRRSRSCRTAPSSRAIVQQVADRIVAAAGLPPYPADVAARSAEPCPRRRSPSSAEV